jgi:DNA-binding NtrC family response regulator
MIKDVLEKVIDEMVCGGILWHEAETEFEKLFIIRVLRQHRGNVSKTAEVMDVHRNTLSKKVRLYSIETREFR